MDEEATLIAPKGKHLARPLRNVRRKVTGKPLTEREYVIAKLQGGLAKTTRKPSMPKFSWDKADD